MTMNGVAVGDKFRNGKHLRAEVVDILECKSLVTGEIVKHLCIAQGLGLARNRFEVCFVTVVRNKIMN